MSLQSLCKQAGLHILHNTGPTLASMSEEVWQCPAARQRGRGERGSCLSSSSPWCGWSRGAASVAELALRSKHSCPGKTLTLMKPSPSRARLNMHKHAHRQPPGSAQHPWSQALEGNATCTISLAAHHLSQEFPTLRQSPSSAGPGGCGWCRGLTCEPPMPLVGLTLPPT